MTMGIRSAIQPGNHLEDAEKNGVPRDFLELRNHAGPSSYSPYNKSKTIEDREQRHLYRVNTSSSDVL